jgi:hypothetical protein
MAPDPEAARDSIRPDENWPELPTKLAAKEFRWPIFPLDLGLMLQHRACQRQASLEEVSERTDKTLPPA